MKYLDDFFSISIKEITYKQKDWQFVIDKDFTFLCPVDILKTASGNCLVKAYHASSCLIAEVNICGTIQLSCDRTLKLFDYPLDIKHKHFFRLGDAFEEEAHNVTVIPRSTDHISFGNLVYEKILLSVPMKKIHPDEINNTSEEGLFYQSHLGKQNTV